MVAFVGTVVLRLASGKVLLRDGDGVLGTHTLRRILGRAVSRGATTRLNAGDPCPGLIDRAVARSRSIAVPRSYG